MNELAPLHTVKTIPWQDSFDTGIADIDDQHRVLINTLNEANTKLRTEARPEEIDQLLKDLLAYAIYHFETEEMLMQEYDYAGGDPEMAGLHVAQHRDFAATAARLREQFLSTGDLDRKALLDYLNGWLTGHILGVDQRLGEYLLSKGWHA